MKFSGRVEHQTLEGGVWLLVTEEGRRLQLTPPPSGIAAGESIEVDGTIDDAAVSFQMVAPILRVRSWHRRDRR